MGRKLPEGWINGLKLEDIFDFKTKSKRKAGDGKTEGEYKFITSSQEIKKFIDNADYNDGEYLVFGTGGSTSIHYMNEKFSTSSDNFIIKIKVNKGNFEEGLETKYVYYYLESNRKIFDEGFTGSGIKHIGKDYIKNIKFFAPKSKSEQQKIVDYLYKQFKFIDNMEKEIYDYEDKLDELEKGILEEAFSKNDGNFTFNNEDYIKIIDGDRGNNYPKKETFTRDGYCLFLNTGNIKKGKFNFSELDFITKEQDEKLRSGKLQNLDIVFTTRGTLGNTALYDRSIVNYENIRINSGMIILRVNIEKIFPKYLIYFLNSKSFKDQLNDLLSGGVIKQIPIRDFKNVKANYTKDLNTQKSIAYKLDKQFELINSTKQEIIKQKQNLKELRKAMLNDIFGGFEE